MNHALFSKDLGGWITDAALLERLVAERMEREAETIRAEGWRWVDIGQEAQAAAWNLRRVWPDKLALCAEDETRRSELAARHDEIAEQHNGSGDDLPEDVAAGLDMRTYWTATKNSYLGRVPKALIVEAVREGAGTRAAGQIAGSKKEVMVADAEQLLVGTGWLPSILRISEASYPVDSGDTYSLTIRQCRSLLSSSFPVSPFLPWAVPHGPVLGAFNERRDGENNPHFRSPSIGRR